MPNVFLFLPWYRGLRIRKITTTTKTTGKTEFNSTLRRLFSALYLSQIIGCPLRTLGSRHELVVYLHFVGGDARCSVEIKKKGGNKSGYTKRWLEQTRASGEQKGGDEGEKVTGVSAGSRWSNLHTPFKRTTLMVFCV